MSNLEEKAVSILDKLNSLATQYTPEVIDGAVSAVMVSSINEIIGAVGGLILCVGIYFLWVWFFKFMTNKIGEDEYSDFIPGKWVGTFIFALVIIITIIANLATLIDLWNWVGVFNPKLALAHKLLGL